jgi:hypothetical protein
MDEFFEFTLATVAFMLACIINVLCFGGAICAIGEVVSYLVHRHGLFGLYGGAL